MSYLEHMRHHLFEPKWPKSNYDEVIAVGEAARRAEEREAAERAADEVAALDQACAEVGLGLDEPERAGGAVGPGLGDALDAGGCGGVEPVAADAVGVDLGVDEPVADDPTPVAIDPTAVAPAEAGAYPGSPDRGEPCVDEVGGDGPLPSQGRRDQGCAEAGESLGRRAEARADVKADRGGVSAPTGFGRGWIPVERDIGLPGEVFGPFAPSAAPAATTPAATASAASTPVEGPGRRDEGGGLREREFVRYCNVAWTPARKVRFLDCLAEHGNVRLACQQVGISPEGAYRLRRRDGVFAEAWAAALVLARVEAQQVLADRALHGFEEEVWFRGELMGTRRRFDSRLLLAHLARLDRLADETTAGARAGRFDELLALVAGETYPADMADCPGARHYDPDPLLPMDRARYVEAAAEQAGRDAHLAAIEPMMEAAVARGEANPDWRGDIDPERMLSPAEREALDDAVYHATLRGREEAGETYDAWLDCSETCVDRAEAASEGAVPGDRALGDAPEDVSGEWPPYEVKSLDGLAPHRAAGGTRSWAAQDWAAQDWAAQDWARQDRARRDRARRDQEGGRVFSQDTVNSVNLPGFARHGGVALTNGSGAFR